MRGLSPQEIGSTMDLPMGVLMAIIIVAQVDYSVLMKPFSMPPLKTIQAAAAFFCFLVAMGWILIPFYHNLPAVFKNYFLAPDTPNISVTNLIYAHSMAFKSDDALMDENIWNLNTLMPLSGRNLYLYSTKKIYNATTHSLVLAWLQVNMS